MRFFIASSSSATSSFSKICNNDGVIYFQDEQQFDDVIPTNMMKKFISADALILSGTWGNDLRKDLYVPKNIPINKIIGKKYSSYRIRSAILDVINSYYIELAKRYKKPIVVFESSTISRAEKNYFNGYSVKSHYRLSLDSWVYGNGKWLEESDFPKQQRISAYRLYDHSWKMNENGSIYILCGSEIDPTSTMNVKHFLETSISKIRKHTNRMIYIKLHPGSPFVHEYQHLFKLYENVKFISQEIPLKNLYEDMYCAVIDNSTSIFELIDAGIPTYCSSVNFGRALNNIDLETINNPYLASKEEVLHWTNKMCCTEIHRANFAKKETVRLVERLVEKHSNVL